MQGGGDVLPQRQDEGLMTRKCEAVLGNQTVLMMRFILYSEVEVNRRWRVMGIKKRSEKY